MLENNPEEFKRLVYSYEIIERKFSELKPLNCESINKKFPKYYVEFNREEKEIGEVKDIYFGNSKYNYYGMICKST